MANTGGRRDDWRTTAPDRTGRGGATGGRAKGMRRWAVAALVVALLVGLLVSMPLLLNKHPEPLCFAVPIGEYHKVSDSVWPPNPWAVSDARGLRDRFEGESAQAFQHQEKGTFTRELRLAAQQARDTRRPLVVYVTALGTVANDTPYLLPADARPNDPNSWLTLDDVLTPVRLGGKERLVILDVRPVRSHRADLPANDVNELIAARLAALEPDDLPVLVLTANTPPAGPLCLPTAKHTAFGLALERGIVGAADGWLPNEAKNHAVSVRELAAYVCECTYAATGGTQLPQLYGHQNDFKLVNVPPNPPESPAPEQLAYPDFLTAAWTDADKARAAGLPARAPRAMRQLTDAAADAERWWLAGASVQVVQGRYAGTFTAFQREWPVALATPATKGVSVAHARQVDTGAFAAQVGAAKNALQPVLSHLKSSKHADARKADLAKAHDLLDAELGKVKVPAEVPFAAVVAVLWAAAVDNPRPWVADDLLYVADNVNLPDKRPLAELAALRVAALVPESRDPNWVNAVLSTWYETTAVAEGAVLFDPRALPAVADRLKGAENAYREEAVAMVNPDTPEERLKQVAPNLLKARAEYIAVGAAAKVVSDAWRQVEGARAALADLADRFPHEFYRRAQAKECSLAGLTDEYATVVGYLRAASPTVGGKLNTSTDALKTQMMEVVPPSKPPRENDPRLLESALEWPGWSTKDRREMVDRLQAASDEVLGRWPVEPSGRVMSPPPKQGPEVFEESIGVLRNQTALVRTWNPEMAKKEQAELAPRTVTPERFTGAAGRVAKERRGGPKGLFQGSPADLAAIGWAVSSHDEPGVPTNPLARTNPEVVVRREAETTFAQRVIVARYRGLSDALTKLDEPPQPGAPRGTRYAPAVVRYGHVADSLDFKP